VKIAADVVTDVEAHARCTAPQECCGLLLGTPDAVTRAVRAHNRASDPQRRYEIDPQDHFAAIRQARAGHVEVVGAYHSHPHSEPIPSETDRAEAFEHFLFMIAGRSRDRSPVAGLRADRPFTIRVWRFSSGNFVEVPLVCDA
jgi:proteasome lid subunit RPN8/RPN11